MLKIGAKLFLRRMSDRREYWHNCRVDDEESRKLIITLPFVGGSCLRLRRDEEIEIGFIYRQEFYCALVRVEGLLKGPPPSFFVTVPTLKEVYLKKRRDAERIDVMLRAKVTYRSDKAGSGAVLKEPVVLNLSRSGMLLSAAEPLNAGDELDLELELMDKSVKIHGGVLGRSKAPSQAKERYHMRVIFMRSDDMTRSVLTKYIRRLFVRQEDR